MDSKLHLTIPTFKKQTDKKNGIKKASPVISLTNTCERIHGEHWIHWTDGIHEEKTERVLENTQCISSCMHFSQTGVEEGIQSQTGCVFAIPLHATHSSYF